MSKNVVLLCTSYGMGCSKHEDLKTRLLEKFCQLLEDMSPLPKAICFYTDGVKLVCEGSPLLGELKKLEDRGVSLVVCKTCLDYYGLTDKVKVGIVGGMPDIMSAMWQADLVISL